MEEILDSKVINWKLWYLVKWEGFRMEHNSWEPWDDIHAPDLIVKFHWKHPEAACQVRAIDFSIIPFCVVPGCHSLEGGWMSGDTHLLLSLYYLPFYFPILFVITSNNYQITACTCVWYWASYQLSTVVYLVLGSILSSSRVPLGSGIV